MVSKHILIHNILYIVPMVCIGVSITPPPPHPHKTCNPPPPLAPFDTHHRKISDSMMIYWNQGD